MDIKTVVEECSHGSDANRLTFPQVLARLAGAGVESYFADLRHATKTYYTGGGAAFEVAVHAHDTAVAADFDSGAIDAALRAVQAGALTYPQFCDRIMAAGCSGYMVSLLGRRAVYFGRAGETHVERFPGS